MSDNGEFLGQVKERLQASFDEKGPDGMWETALEYAAQMVETLHLPPAPSIDGWRDIATFIQYMEEESRVMPLAFESAEVTAEFSVEGDSIVVDPFVRTGRLITPGHRTVRMQSRIELRFEQEKLVSVMGIRSRNTLKEDALAWLAALQSVGGFNPPPALASV